MDLTERQLSRETIYEGKILHIYRDDVLLPNGRTSVREVADHPGGVAIVALDENDNVLTVKQYRYVFSRVLEEIPAGKFEGLSFGEQNPDEDEFLELYRTPFSDMLARVMRGEIEDAKTVCGILKVHALRTAQKERQEKEN